MSSAIFAGSFNPFTLGHIDIIAKAAEIFDELYVVIAQNANKPKSHTSVKTIEKDLKAWTVEGVKVIELPKKKLLVDFAEEKEIKFLVRGLRNTRDAMTELEMADVNNNLAYVEVETVFFLSSPSCCSVSSSLVRSLVGTDGWKERVHSFLPKYSAEEFIKNNGEKS